jgi:hypothetical protein
VVHRNHFRLHSETDMTEGIDRELPLEHQVRPQMRTDDDQPNSDQTGAPSFSFRRMLLGFALAPFAMAMCAHCDGPGPSDPIP